MRRLASAVVLLAVAAIAAPVAATPPANPFAGAWENVDVDGSNQRMTVGNGATIRVQYRDDGGSICLANDLGFVPATVRGTATLVDADTLEFGPADVYCHPRGGGGPVLVLPNNVVIFDYDATSNTLTDNFGNCWHRPGDPAACAP